MMNAVWLALILVSLVTAAFTGQMGAVTNALVAWSAKSVEMQPLTAQISTTSGASSQSTPGETVLYIYPIGIMGIGRVSLDGLDDSRNVAAGEPRPWEVPRLRP